MAEAQPGIFFEGAAAGFSLELEVVGDPSAAWSRLTELDIAGSVVGIGQPFAAAVGVQIAGLRSFERIAGQATMPATQHALWVFVPAADQSSAFEKAERWKMQLEPHFRLVEGTALFRYRDGRDLTGYRDGSANPHGDEAIDAAILAEGPLRGGSFVLLQRYVHFRSRFFRLDQDTKDRIVGRRLSDDEELEDAPASAHVKRADQEGFAEPTPMLRRSMPWGDPRRHGLQFIAFMTDLARSDRVLRRMAGLEDGTKDALLGHTQAETGAYYFCPPVKAGRLALLADNQGAAKPSALEVVESAAVRIRFEAKKCVHSRHCVLARPDVFVPNVVGEWIHPEVATADEVAELAHSCPSGAIQYDRLDGGSAERAPKVNTLRVRENGPYAVHADLQLAGRPAGYRATLCRCGASENKPFCDGSHVRVGFVATGEPPTIDMPALAKRDGPLFITPQTDGPLVVDGPVELVSGTGRTIAKTTGPTLCRCGNSANKPYCDGSHARVGFKALGD